MGQSPQHPEGLNMPGKEAIPIGCSAIKPVERHGWEAVAWFLYDRNTGAIMGRTPLSWLLITIFYIIYYACLAGFWLLMLMIFFQSIEYDKPKWDHGSGSLIGKSPALGVRPGQSWENIDSSMIIFNTNKMKDGKTIPGYAQWVRRTNMFLEEKAYQMLDFYNKANTDSDRTEEVVIRTKELTNLGPCSGEQDPDFGYSTGKPCILLKLNRIYGLDPEYITNPWENMPHELRYRIKAAKHKEQVWVSCEGENAADKESMGEIEYFLPDGGFPSNYYPYLNQGTLSPLIAVRFRNPRIGQLIHVECRAWAGNIDYHRRDRIGIAHFELMIHNDGTANATDGYTAT